MLVLVFLFDSQVFFQAFAKLLARTEAFQLALIRFLCLIDFRALVFLERRELTCLFCRLLACGYFLFQCYVALELSTQQILAGDQ
ncbi:hypothetical protein D3C78_1858220 [compost metagenome]